MPQRSVSFVIRVLVTEGAQLRWGILYQVPNDRPIRFRTWDELLVLIQEELGGPEDQQARDPAAAPDKS